MDKNLFEALEALCMMWEQYCSGKSGHDFMSAGEETADVLDKYKLLKYETCFCGRVDSEKLEEYRKSLKN